MAQEAPTERAATRNVAAAENGLLCLSTYTLLFTIFIFTDPHTQSLWYTRINTIFHST